MLSLEQARIDVLLSLFGHLHTSEDEDVVLPSELKVASQSMLSSAYIRRILLMLCEDELVVTYDRSYQSETFRITDSGIARAESILKDEGRTVAEFISQFPHDHRIGHIIDNSEAHPDLSSAKAELAKLATQLRQGNDLGDMTLEERDAALIEVEQLGETLEKPVIRLNFLWQKAHETLRWIADKGGSAMIGELAKKALKHIVDFVNVFLN